MSNGTTPTQIRIPYELKARAKAKAAANGLTLTDVVIRALNEYVDTVAESGRDTG